MPDISVPTFSSGDSTRLQHGRDESVHQPALPDGVVMAESTEEVALAVRLCAEHGVPIIPYGVGSSVEGHVLAPGGGISLDLSGMNRVIAIHAEDGDAVVEAGVTRNGNQVPVKMVAVRSSFSPTSFEVNRGDIVTIAVTNIEQTTDELHGFGLLDYNINLVVDPGETKQVTFTATKPGVFAYYCTNFCSALHQEMQGYMIAK